MSQRTAPRNLASEKAAGMYRDYPFNDVVAKANDVIRAGHIVHQKFTCAGCGSRLTIETPNTFHELGTCDKCPATTDIKARGCNYMIVTGAPRPSGIRTP